MLKRKESENYRRKVLKHQIRRWKKVLILQTKKAVSFIVFSIEVSACAASIFHPIHAQNGECN